MKMHQRVCLVLLAAVLLSVCFAAPAETPVEGDIDLYVTTAAVESRTDSPDVDRVLWTLRYLYPDYISVNLHVVVLDGQEARETYHGLLPEYLAQPADAKAANGGETVNLAQVLEDARPERTRLLVFCGEEQDPLTLLGCDSRGNVPVPFAAISPLPIPDGEPRETERKTPSNHSGEGVTARASASSDQEAAFPMVWLREKDGSLLEAALDAYQLLERGNFPQICSLEPVENGLIHLVPPENRPQRLNCIIVEGTPEEQTDSALFPRQETADCITVYAGAAVEEEQVIRVGSTTKVLVNRVLEPFQLTVSGLDEKETFSSTERPALTVGMVITDGENSAFFGETQHWTIGSLVGEQQTPETRWASGEDSAPSVTLDLTRLTTGDWPVTVTANLDECPGLDYSCVINLQVKNDAPAIKEEQTRTPKADWWLDTPVMPKEETQPAVFPLRDCFTDDGGAENLTFHVTPEADWYSVADGTLTVDLKQIPRDEMQTLTVTAEDSAGQKSEELTFQLTARSVREELKKAKITLIPTVQERILSTKYTYQLPESLQSYLDRLGEEQAAFLADLTPSLTLNDESLEVTIPDTWNGLECIYSVADKGPLPTGSYALTAAVSLRDEGAGESTRTEDITESTRTEDITVENVGPSLEVANPEQVSLLIPGPLFLQRDVPEAEQQKVYPLGQLIKTEALDKITVTPKEGDMRLFQNGSEWLLTDETEEQMPEGWKAADQLEWDTTNGGEAPTLIIRHRGYGETKQTLEFKDQDDGQAKLTLTITAIYRNDAMLRLILWIVIGIVAAVIAAAVIRQLLKPRFTPDSKLQVRFGQYKGMLPLVSWGKKGISLTDVLIYTGIPYAGELPPKLNKLMLMPGGNKCGLMLCNAARCDVMVTKDGADQDSNKIRIDSGNEVKIGLEDGSSLILSID